MKSNKLSDSFLLKMLIKSDANAAKNIITAIDRSTTFDEFMATEGMEPAMKMVERAHVPGARNLFQRMFTRLKNRPEDMEKLKQELAKKGA